MRALSLSITRETRIVYGHFVEQHRMCFGFETKAEQTYRGRRIAEEIRWRRLQLQRDKAGTYEERGRGPVDEVGKKKSWHSPSNTGRGWKKPYY